jgi:hypothetical protein
MKIRKPFLQHISYSFLDSGPPGLCGSFLFPKFFPQLAQLAAGPARSGLCGAVQPTWGRLPPLTTPTSNAATACRSFALLHAEKPSHPLSSLKQHLLPSFLLPITGDVLTMHTATIITQVDRLPKPMKESHASASLRGNRPCPHIAFSSLQARCRRASPATVVPLRRRTVTAAAPSAIAHGEDLLELLSLFLHSQR